MIISNSIISIISAFIIGLLVIIVVPLYLNYLNYESYALIGISFVINSFSQIFDFGFHQIVMRKTTLFSSGKYSNLDLKILLRSIEIFLLMFLILIMFFLVLYSESIFSNFFNADYLSPEKGSFSIILIVLILFAKSFYGLYRGGIQGFEKFKWIAVVSVIFNILRYPGGLLLLINKPDINIFFTFQLLISCVELFIFRSKYIGIFQTEVKNNFYFSWRHLINELNFSKSLTFLAILWVLSMHLDKFILMNALTMEEFGFFTTIMIFSTGLLGMAVPFGNVVIARLTFVNSDVNIKKIENIYGDMTQLAVLIFFPVAITIAIYSWEFIFLFTSNAEVATWGQLILSMFMIGNIFYIMGTFQYYLQLSNGNLSLHTTYATFLFIIYSPVVYYLIYKYGAYGAAFSWLFFRSFTFFVWIPIVHKRLIPGIHWRWLKYNIISLLIGGMVPVIIWIYIYPDVHIMDKTDILFSIIISWLSIFLSLCIFSSFMRKILFKKYAL